MNRLLTAMVLALGLMLVLLPGCKKDTPGSARLGDLKGSAAGVEWGVPKRWTVKPDRPFRVVTYAVPAAEGDAEDGECYVAFFEGQGGSVADNINRWVGQFENASSPVQDSKEVNGLKVSTVQVNGTFVGMGGMMMQGAPKKDNYRLIGAIVEGPKGLVFLKCTGPVKTATAAEPEFDALINSLKK